MAITDRQLQDILDSGELSGGKLGGSALSNNIITQAELTTVSDQTALNTASIANFTEIQALFAEPTGYDLRPDHVAKKGIMEFCLSAVVGEYWRLTSDDTWSKHTGASQFGDGSTLTDRTFIHYPETAETYFEFWHNGINFQKTSTQVLEIASTSDKQIVVYDASGTLTLASSVYSAIVEDVVTSVITINHINTEKVIFANERHGVQMDGTTHMMLHSTQGATWASGLFIDGLSDNSDTFSNVTAGVFYDEDITHFLLDHDTAPFMWREGVGGGWRVSTNIDNKLGFFNGGASVQYNLDTSGTWSLEPIGSQYMIMHFFASNDAEYPIVKVVGQNLYTSAAIARDQIFSEGMDLAEGSLPTPEFLPLGCMIIHLDGVGQIEKGLNDEIWLDCRAGTAVPRF